MVEPPESLVAKILFRQRSNELQPNDIESLNLPALSRLEDAMLIDVPQGLAARVIAAKDSEKAASHESGEKSASNIVLFQPRQLIKFAMAASIAVAVAAVSLLSLNRETPTLAVRSGGARRVRGSSAKRRRRTRAWGFGTDPAHRWCRPL